MAMNLVPLNKETHKSVKVGFSPAFNFARSTHIAAATIKEFAQLSNSMPIVMIKDQNDRFLTVAMLGFEAEQNLFLQGDRWAAPHIPMNIARYPFDIRPNGDKLTIYIDENSDLLEVDNAQPLFEENGEASALLKDRQEFLTVLANSEMVTHRFVDKLVELELLEEIEIRLAYDNGQQRNITGMFSINEKNLLELPDEKVLELHKNGFLGAAYSVMLSMGQLSRLVELSAKTDNPVQALQINRPSDDKGEESSAANQS